GDFTTIGRAAAACNIHVDPGPGEGRAALGGHHVRRPGRWTASDGRVTGLRPAVGSADRARSHRLGLGNSVPFRQIQSWSHSTVATLVQPWGCVPTPPNGAHENHARTRRAPRRRGAGARTGRPDRRAVRTVPAPERADRLPAP